MALNKNKVMDAARKAHEKGQYDKAIREYQRIVKEDANDVRVWLKIGDLYARVDNKAEATATYQRVAKFYSEQGFYLKAVAVYKQILKLDPRLVEVNLKLAELYRQLGLMSDAVQHFEMVAAFFHREGKTKEALATIRQLVDLDPDNVATRIKLAELYSKEGLKDEAVTEFTHVCRQLRQQDREEDFIKVAERLLFHKADDMELCREMAGLYLRRDDPRRALAKLQTCFKSNPTDVDTLGMLAEAFQKLQQKGKTVSVLKELARVLVETGKRNQAVDIHQRILSLVPNDRDSLAFLGQAPAGPSVQKPAAPAVGVGLRPHPVVDARQRQSAPSQRFEGNPVGRATGARPLIDEPTGDLDISFQSRVKDERSTAPMETVGEHLDEISSVGRATPSDAIIKILTETDVYVKYGLHHKAIEHLRRLFDIEPDNIDARERLKDILIGQGETEQAIDELLILADQTADTHPDQACVYLMEIAEIEPGNRRARALADQHGLSVPGLAEPKTAPTPSVDPIEFGDLEFDDIRSHVAAELNQANSDADDFSMNMEFSAPDEAVISQVTADEAAVDQILQPKGGQLSSSPTTVEVDVGQVEEAFVVESSLAADFIFGDDEGEFEFDPDDAAAFDADRVAQSDLSDDSFYSSDSDPLFSSLEGPLLGVSSSHDAHQEPSFAPPDEGPLFAAEDSVDFLDDDEVEELDSDDLLEEDSMSDDSELLPHGTAGVPEGVSAAQSHPLDFAAVLATSKPSLGDLSVRDADDGIEASELHLVSDDDIGSPSVVDVDSASLEDELDEAAFFASQGLVEEAREILEALRAQHPNNSLVASKLAALSGDTTGEGSDDTQLEVIDAESLDAFEFEGSSESIVLESPVDDEDADTHYDLGLAYREMGLHGEAIKAFEKVISVKGREVQCHIMIGLCKREQGLVTDAIDQFKAGLFVEGVSAAEKFDLYFEIGSAYEVLADLPEALYYYEMVSKKDPGYRDVETRVERLRAASGGAPRDDRADGLPWVGSDRSG